MIKSIYKCNSCYGRFDISKGYEEDENDIPKFCPWCGTETITKEREYQPAFSFYKDEKRVK